jgi:thioredoxin 1
MPTEKSIALAIVIIALGLFLFIFITNPSPIDTGNLLSVLKNSDSQGPLDLNETALSLMVNKSPFLVLDVYYPGCAPCKTMNVTITELSNELGDQVAFGRINIKENKEIVNKYKVSSYPAILMFSDGILVNRLKGNVSKEDLVTELKSIEPKLDTRMVKTRTAPASKNDTNYVIPLAKVGERIPSRPMLITDSNLNQAIKNYPYLVVDTFADWCGACHPLNTTLAELAQELKGKVAFGLINGPKNNETKQKYNITAYPTMLVFKDGELRDKLVGNRAKSVFVSELKKYEPQPDTSKVKLSSAPTTPAATAATAGTSPPREIPLARLGEMNPALPMLVTDSTIDKAAKQYPFLVLEEFANWCGFCRMMNVTISELSSELQGQMAFGLINAEKNNDTKKKYNVTAYPTLLIFKDGQMVEKVIGNQDKSAFVSKLKKLEPKLNTSKVRFPPPKPIAPAQPKMSPEEACAKMNKSRDPVLEAYVVSRCPFGLQMQRIMYNIIAEVPEASKNMMVRYMGSVEKSTITSMHGDIEAQENLRQICLREEQSNKYWDYVGCYMKENKSDDCLALESIDKAKLEGCMADPSRGLGYAQKDFGLADNYGITGSPTLIMNQGRVSEFNFATNETNGRSPEAVKNLLCCGFKTMPSFCTKELNKTRAATMFAA